MFAVPFLAIGGPFFLDVFTKVKSFFKGKPCTLRLETRESDQLKWLMALSLKEKEVLRGRC